MENVAEVQRHWRNYFGTQATHAPITRLCDHEIMWNANLMQQSNFIDVFLARPVSGTYAHHQEH